MNKQDFVNKMNSEITIAKKMIETVHLLRDNADKWNGKVINKRYFDAMSNASGTHETAPDWRGETRQVPNISFGFYGYYCPSVAKQIRFTIHTIPGSHDETEMRVYGDYNDPYIDADSNRLDAEKFKAALDGAERNLLNVIATREKSIAEYDKYKAFFDELNKTIDENAGKYASAS